MATEIKMPQLGESVVEGTITKWLKQEGDSVDEDELLVEVSTDKVDSEVPSSAAGTIQKILVSEGETVKVGTAIALVGEGAAESDGQAESGDDSEEPEQTEQPEEPEGEAAEEGPEAEASDEDEEEPDEKARETEPSEGDVGKEDAEAEAEEDSVEEAAEEAPAASAEPSTEEKEPSAQQAVDSSDGGEDTSKRGVISPLVRRLADEHNLDLSKVEGSGTGGRIRKQDVLAFLEKVEQAPAETEKADKTEKASASAAKKEAPAKRETKDASLESGTREELVPWTNIRRRTAEHMVASVRETARAWNAVEIDWTPLVAMRGQVKANFKKREGFNLTYMGFLGRALCETLLEMPEVNSTYDEENQANRLKHYVNLGIAVALEGGGLIVPVVKGADEKNLVGLARSINEIVIKARSKKLAPDDLQGGSFTITNPGPFGSVVSVPIIPRGQAAILSFEAIGKRVVVTEDDSIAIRSTGFVTLSWDHRVIDGAEASQFLALLKKRLETMDFSSELAHYL
jgi:pyruvate dehydrogenase E2 component (dihydrolipoamide acetyltransferase)